MKTAIITVFTALSLTAGIANPTKAATLKGDANTYTVLTDISAINKIEIHGNVELYVSDGASDQVKVYNKYYSESALVQSTNGVLRISSYKPEKLVVWVSANDLRAISAYDNAEVKSFGNISKIEFAVDLHDNAAAKLNLNAFAASLTVKDNARADLTGSADQLNLYRDIESNVKSNNFSAAHYLENKITVAGNDLAGL
ncbi:MAG: GIN domain-containing protein [Mucilaginibacter sp.]